MDHLEGPLQLERASPSLALATESRKLWSHQDWPTRLRFMSETNAKKAHHFMSIATQPLETMNSFLGLHRESEVNN